MKLEILKKELEIRKAHNHIDEARRLVILKNSNQMLSIVKGAPSEAFVICMEELAELISAKLDFDNCGLYTKTPDVDTKISLEEEIADVQISIDKVCDILNIDISEAKKDIENDDTDQYITNNMPVIFNASETIKSISKFIRYQDDDDSINDILNMISNMLGLLITLKEYINSSSILDAEEIEYIKDIKYMRQANRDAEYLTSATQHKMHEIAEKFENAHSSDDIKTSTADAIAKVVYTNKNKLSKSVINKIPSFIKEE